MDLEKTNILRIKQQYSFNEAFLKARLDLGKNKEFEWGGNRYSTNYPDESKAPPLVLEIEIIKDNLKQKSKELDESIIKANNQITTLDNYIKKVKDDNNNNIIVPQFLNFTPGFKYIMRQIFYFFWINLVDCMIFFPKG